MIDAESVVERLEAEGYEITEAHYNLICDELDDAAEKISEDHFNEIVRELRLRVGLSKKEKGAHIHESG
jgi:hypothetical protein